MDNKEKEINRTTKMPYRNTEQKKENYIIRRTSTRKPSSPYKLQSCFNVQKQSRKINIIVKSNLREWIQCTQLHVSCNEWKSCVMVKLLQWLLVETKIVKQ